MHALLQPYLYNHCGLALASVKQLGRVTIGDMTDVTIGGSLYELHQTLLLQLQQTFWKNPSFPIADTINGWEQDYLGFSG